MERVVNLVLTTIDRDSDQLKWAYEYELRSGDSVDGIGRRWLEEKLIASPNFEETVGHEATFGPQKSSNLQWHANTSPSRLGQATWTA